MWGKRSSPYGTLLGAISGATPPVVGYAAVTGHLDLAALILFFILAFWQMPHFYAIAIYRMKEYEAAGVPVLPAKAGVRATKIDMLIYIILFAAAALALGAFGYANALYSGLAAVLSFIWLWFSLQGFAAKDDNRWARKMFFYSLITLTVLFVSMAVSWMA